MVFPCIGSLTHVTICPALRIARIRCGSFTLMFLQMWNLNEKGGELFSALADDPFSWKDAILRCLYYVRENNAAVMSALRSIENQQIRGFFIRYFHQVFAGLFDFICRDLDVDQEFKDFIANLHIVGAAGMVVQWLESGMKESPEQITEWLAFYLEGNVRGTFERYAERKNNR